MSPINSNSKLTRRQVLQGTTALAVTSFLVGCPSPNPSTTLNAANPQVVPSGTLTPATVTVGSATAGSIPALFAGLSYEKSTMNQSPYLWTYTAPTGSSGGVASNPLAQAMNRLELSSTQSGLGLMAGSGGILRVGGLSVDQNVWTPKGAGKVSGQIAPADVDALANFAANVGWQVIYGINLGGSAPGASYPTTTVLAAAEVTYVLSSFASHGAKTPWFELGNEPDNYGNAGNAYASTGLTLTQFETLWSTYRTAILAASPSAILTGPACANNEAAWTVPFATYAKGQITLLTQHYYRGAGATGTTANLISYPDTTLQGYLAQLQTAAATAGVPFRLSETNSYTQAGTTGTSGVANGYGSALWAIDHLFTCAQGGAAGVNFHGGGNAATGYQPISDSGGTVTSINPEYYGILFFNMAGTGNLLQTTVSANSLNVSAYAVQSASGGINLVINNKDLTNNLQMAVALPQTVSNGLLVELTQATTGVNGPTLTASSGVMIGGDPVNGIPGATASITAYSITGNVVTFTANNAFAAGEVVTLSGFGATVPGYPPSESPAVYFNSLVTKITSATATSFTINFAQNANTPLTQVSGAAAAITAPGQVAIDGGYSPKAAYSLSPSGNSVTCYVPALSAVLLTLS